MDVLAIIPARGGSTAIPRKNIKLLHGKPLLAYTIESASNAKRLKRTILSTDDEEIAAIGKELGVDVPFLRPKELARNSSPTLPVVQHALSRLEAAGERFDAVCLLQPTNPLRRPFDIDRCIELLEENGVDSVISVLPVPAEYNPHWVYGKRDDGSLELYLGGTDPIARRQDLPPAFHREGSVYVTRSSVITTQNSLYGKTILGYEIPAEFASNIDDPSDWEAVEGRMFERHQNAAV